jgi:hypothetical protein
MLLAACGSTITPTAAPTAPPLATPVVTPPPPSATPIPTAAPPTCSPSGSPQGAILGIRAIDERAEIELGPIGDVPTFEPPSPDATPAVDPDVTPAATVLGGTDLDLRLGIESFDGDSATITSLVAQFQPSEGAAADVEVTVVGDEASLRLPDADAVGTLRAEARWSTLCGDREGGGTIVLRVLDSSVAAGCPTTQDGLLQSVIALQDEQVAYDTLEVPIRITGWSGRWMLGNAVDDFPQFSGWDQVSSVAVQTGTSIVLRESIDDVSLISVRAAFYRREDVEAYLDPDSTIELNTVDIQRRSAGAKGRIGIPVTLDPGRYVMEVQGEAQAPCLNVQTYQVISVDVSRLVIL